MTPAIVISAYNRPNSLSRLLGSIQNARYPDGVEIPLVISIDHANEQPQTVAVAQKFPWEHGPKQVIQQKQALGLRKHFFLCGDLAESYGSIIYLEDDLFVSPVFFPYAAKMLEFYQPDDHIAGISLYSLWFNGYNRLPFIPLQDASDVFFVQVPYTQGEAFTWEQWSRFRAWFGDNEDQKSLSIPFHESWARFSPDEWFPSLARYMVATNRFFVFPRISLTTGMGDVGSHFARNTGFFQTPLQDEKVAYIPKSLHNSNAVYDSFFEILPSRLNRLTNIFQSYEYCVDLYCTRARADIRSEFVLTTRSCKHPIFSVGKSMFPWEANILNCIPGDEISFCRKSDLQWGWWQDLKAQEGNRAYYSKGHLPGMKSLLKSKLVKFIHNSYLNLRFFK